MSSFHPNFDRKEILSTQWIRNSVLLLNGLCRPTYKLGWTAHIMTVHDNNQYFFETTWTTSDAVFAEMQRITCSYSVIILKHIQIDLHFKKLLMPKVWSYLGGGGGGQSVHKQIATPNKFVWIFPLCLKEQRNKNQY